MDVLLAVVAGLAVAMHMYIFIMESMRWEHPATQRVFGMSEEEARLTNEMAYNQGFYNLFLAVILAAGTLMRLGGSDAGGPLMVAGAGSMAAAAVVLVARSPSRLRAAIGQALFPVLTLVVLLIA